jgi:tetratricopeptide (TPR) repeat protein
MTILSALRKSFAYCEIRFLRGNYYLLTCSNEPIKNQRRFSDILPEDHPLVRNLKRALAFQDLDEYFVDIRLSENVFDHFEPKVDRENTDDHPVLEFMVVRDYQLGAMGSDPFLEDQKLLNIKPFDEDELKDPERFARKAVLYWHLGSDFFTTTFQPVLMKEETIAPEFFYLAAKHKVLEKKYSEAMPLLTTAVKIQPDQAKAYNLMGTVFKRTDQIDGAITNFNQAVKVNPDYLEARCNLADAIGSKGFNADAEKILQQSLELSKDSDTAVLAGTHFSLAKVLQKQDKQQEALNYFELAINGYQDVLEQDPDSLQTLINFGDALVEVEKPEQAVSYYQQALSMEPMGVDTHVKLVMALKISGDAEKAIETAHASMAFFERLDKKEAVGTLQALAEKIKAR